MADDVVKKLERLTEHLEAAHEATKKTLKEVREAKRTSEKARRAVRIKQRPDYTKKKRAKR
jgi:hypothetical protein